MNHSLIKKLEKKLLPEFETVTEQINQNYSRISARAYGYTVGALTQYQGYSFCIDCIIEDAPSNDPDNIGLTVDLVHLTTIPKIDAGIAWGHPSGYCEASFRDYTGKFPSKQSLKVSDEVLDDLYKDLPRFYKILLNALERRKPPGK